jgi:hypothetical protein
MERGPFLAKPVQKEFRRFVEILLHTDGPEENRKNREFQRERFGTIALPYYVILDPTGTEVLWRGGGAHTAEEFAASLKIAR